MDNNIAIKLNSLRKARNLSVQELAHRAGVSAGLISGIIHGYRIIGEKTARKIAGALNIQGEELEEFIHLALNNGCTRKVLNSSKGFPSEVLNLIASELNAAGIFPEMINHYVRLPDNVTGALQLKDGKSAYINVEVSIR